MTSAPVIAYDAFVDPDAVLAYALATNDPNPLCSSGAVASPLYTAPLIVRAFGAAIADAVPAGAITGARAAVHAMHDVHLLKPIAIGSKVRIEGRHYGVQQTPAGVAITSDLRVLDTAGELLVRHFWTIIHIGGTIAHEIGELPPAHLFPDQARECPLGSFTFDITPDQGFRYGGASGDRNGHAIDDEVARSEGFPGKIIQGLCTFAMCSGAVVQLAGGGDPAALTRIAGRFSSPVFPRQQLVVELFDAGRSEQGARLVAFEAKSNGVTVVKHGRAEFRP